MQLTALPVDLLEKVTNHKSLDQRALCSVSKEVKATVDAKADKLRKLTYSCFENEYYLFQEIQDVVELHDYTTIYMDGEEWYVDNAGWP